MFVSGLVINQSISMLALKNSTRKSSQYAITYTQVIFNFLFNTKSSVVN